MVHSDAILCEATPVDVEVTVLRRASTHPGDQRSDLIVSHVGSYFDNLPDAFVA
jgi:hypothetical protein